jgi:predicted AAA+ superfamily ATPase
MNTTPWRENVVPHRDVLEGTFQQSEFAADISAVRAGRAPRQYQDPVTFFQRTFITEGMRLLLTQVARRLAGQDGDPVIQLKTAFGGGKTHTLLAVHHLATRACPLADLAGIPELLDRAGLMDVPKARVAVLDGTALGPAQPRRFGSRTVRTLWGELAWQLGGGEACDRIQAADESGTNPGKDLLRELLEAHAPCVVLMDELVAYLRQFGPGKALPGGTWESNLSFVQSLTEAAKLVPNAIVLASLPESETEAGGEAGARALESLKKTFGRVQAVWKPVETEESFEIVRRRLFENVRNETTRAEVCRAFVDLYVSEGARLPGETQEGRYLDRLLRAYPIHPEVFDRLYEDWSTIENFQRTRGVLKLMAKVIHKLWQNGNRDLLILPGSLPLDDTSVRNELAELLPAGWDPVIERDIDGPKSETDELEKREVRFGTLNAARRVARTLFLGTAPSSVAAKRGNRGLERSRVLLGCLQPGQASSVYADALARLADRCHYLNSSGDRSQESTRYWFDTRANLRREMEDRKRRFEDATDVRDRLAHVLRKLIASATFFDGIHLFTPHADVPDDSALRLVVLGPETPYFREDPTLAFDAVLEHVRQHGPQPRFRSNRLLFLAADHGTLARARDAARTELAWQSIVTEVEERRLNLDGTQFDQAKRELRNAGEVLPRVIRDAFKWLLVPGLDSPTATRPSVEAFPVVTASGTLGDEVKRVCVDNELVITTWAPVHLRSRLRDLYWKPGRPAVRALDFWEDCQRYLYLPRLRSRDTLEDVLRRGSTSRDFFATASGGSAGHWDGFGFGNGSAALDDSLLLLDPEVAKAFEESRKEPSTATTPPTTGYETGGSQQPPGELREGTKTTPEPPSKPLPDGPQSFHASASVSAATARIRLLELATELIERMRDDPTADIRITLEIDARFPKGISPDLKRTLSENARTLGMKNADWDSSC